MTHIRGRRDATERRRREGRASPGTQVTGTQRPHMASSLVKKEDRLLCL